MAELRKQLNSGISSRELDRAATLLQTETESGRLGAAAILVTRNGQVMLHEGFGRLSAAPGAPAVQPESVFLTASISKPVTAASVMLLVDRGMLSLDDPVNYYLPKFGGDERGEVLVRDLLSHTSGLPDMLPENIELRRQHAPLSTFVEHTYATPLLFSPRTQFRYQSMGFLLAATIVEKLSGVPFRDFTKSEIFCPLGMKDSSFGLAGRHLGDLVQCAALPGADLRDEKLFGWNTSYWRDLGAPWGGMHSTTSDLAILLETFLHDGVHAGHQLFRPATVKAMTSDQNAQLDAPWGLGWALGRSRVWNAFGDLLPSNTFGHAGATGTLAWADPGSKLSCVILTNRPYDTDNGHLLRLISDVVASSVDPVN
jgi:CubicO group peptidase (beta-lactamase class C family)